MINENMVYIKHLSKQGKICFKPMQLNSSNMEILRYLKKHKGNAEIRKIEMDDEFNMKSIQYHINEFFFGILNITDPKYTTWDSTQHIIAINRNDKSEITPVYISNSSKVLCISGIPLFKNKTLINYVPYKLENGAVITPMNRITYINSIRNNLKHCLSTEEQGYRFDMFYDELEPVLNAKLAYNI